MARRRIDAATLRARRFGDGPATRAAIATGSTGAPVTAGSSGAAITTSATGTAIASRSTGATVPTSATRPAVAASATGSAITSRSAGPAVAASTTGSTIASGSPGSARSASATAATGTAAATSAAVTTLAAAASVIVEVRSRVPVDGDGVEVLGLELSPVVGATRADQCDGRRRDGTQNVSSHWKLPRTPTHAGPAATSAWKRGGAAALASFAFGRLTR